MRLRVSIFFAAGMLLTTSLAAADSPDGTEKVVRYDKGLRVGRPSDVASITIGARAQGRYTHTRRRDEPAADEWSAQRLRLSGQGHIGTPRLWYYSQLAFEEGFEVLDAMAELTVAPDALRIRVGKWKMPTARHHLNSSGRLALVDRAITHRAFDASRGIGLMLHNGVEEQRFGWAVGGFLDDTNRLRFADRGDAVNVARPYEPALAARIGINHGDLDVTDEICWSGESARAAAGAYVLESLDTNGDGDGRLRSGVDWIVGYGPLSVSGDIQVAFQHTADGTVFDGYGFHQQVAALMFGYVAPALRLAVVDPTADAVEIELTAGLTGFVLKHRLKLGADLSSLRSPTSPPETRARVQAQVIF